MPNDMSKKQEGQGGLWNRFRIGPIVKVALIMLLLEVKPVWFFVYFFAVFLFLGGIFDPIVDWYVFCQSHRRFRKRIIHYQ